MKYCPECRANVEGLLKWCDCCGAPLKPQPKHLFKCSTYGLPQCLGLSTLTHEMIDSIQPNNTERYEAFIETIGVGVVCYPESLLIAGNIKNRLNYSQKNKYASITITVNYNDFIKADMEKKRNLIATSLLQGIHLLQTRLYKDKLDINDIVSHAEVALSQYIK